MIWPFRPKTQAPEAPLWTLLDRCGLPFRETVDQWVDASTVVPSGWDDGVDHCRLNIQTKLFAAHDVPAYLRLSKFTDRTRPPDCICAAVHGTGDHRLNYAAAIAGLVKPLGKGVVQSNPSSIARIWTLGAAKVTCTVRLPNPETTSLPRDVRQDALIEIYPAWSPS